MTCLYIVRPGIIFNKYLLFFKIIIQEMHLENLESTKIYKEKIKLTYNRTTESHYYNCISLGAFFLCLCVYNLFFRILGSYYLISVGSYFLKLIHINISTITQSSIIFAIFLHYN